MQVRLLARALAVASSSVALLAALAHCSSSHPPIAQDVGNGSTGGGQATTGQCYEDVVDGGCSLPFHFPGLPLDTPIKQSDLPAMPEGGGGGICLEVPVGVGFCASSQGRRFTCVAEGVFTVTNEPGCVSDGGPGDAAAEEAGDAGAD